MASDTSATPRTPASAVSNKLDHMIGVGTGTDGLFGCAVGLCHMCDYERRCVFDARSTKTNGEVLELQERINALTAQLAVAGTWSMKRLISDTEYRVSTNREISRLNCKLDELHAWYGPGFDRHTSGAPNYTTCSWAGTNGVRYPHFPARDAILVGTGEFQHITAELSLLRYDNARLKGLSANQAKTIEGDSKKIKELLALPSPRNTLGPVRRSIIREKPDGSSVTLVNEYKTGSPGECFALIPTDEYDKMALALEGTPKTIKDLQERNAAQAANLQSTVAVSNARALVIASGVELLQSISGRIEPLLDYSEFEGEVTEDDINTGLDELTGIVADISDALDAAGMTDTPATSKLKEIAAVANAYLHDTPLEDPTLRHGKAVTKIKQLYDLASA